LGNDQSQSVLFGSPLAVVPDQFIKPLPQITLETHIPRLPLSGWDKKQADGYSQTNSDDA
jgi:hypothetical protein